jgi:hypothetical protein
MKKTLVGIFLFVIVIGNGCQQSTPNKEITVDPHPARFLSFETNDGHIITGDTAVINLFLNDTISFRITAYDKDTLTYWSITEKGKFVAEASAPKSDTMVIQSGFIGDTTYFPIGIANQREFIVHDALGYTAEKVVELYIKQRTN